MDKTNEHHVADRDESVTESDRLRRAMSHVGFPYVAFSVCKEVLDEEGLWNPPDDGDPRIDGGLQINVFGDRSHYLRLAEVLRQFAEEDSSQDGDHHVHVEPIFTYDRKLRVNLILRKDDVGDASWR